VGTQSFLNVGMKMRLMLSLDNLLGGWIGLVAELKMEWDSMSSLTEFSG
jgi:hypothetical protein